MSKLPPAKQVALLVPQSGKLQEAERLRSFNFQSRAQQAVGWNNQNEDQFVVSAFIEAVKPTKGGRENVK